ncbi:MAG: septal ring lytic transglycosylase RlpA family protein [Mariprofundaceae bacterium]
MKKHLLSLNPILPFLLLMTISACGSRAHVSTHSSVGTHSTIATNAYGGHRKIGTPYSVSGRTYYPINSAVGYHQYGIASWYGEKFHGRKTANGETYDMYAFTAAHRTLPLPTQVRVTNKENGKSIIVRVNDRGPFVKDRLIDLSYAAARALGVIQKGTAEVYVKSLESPIQFQPMPQKIVELDPAPSQIYIQLGAFSTAENASRLQNRLVNDYPKAHLHEFTHHSKGSIFRVRLGPYQDMVKTEQDMSSLKGHGFSNAIIVMK